MAATLSLTEGVGRQLDYWLTVYKRTWKASVVSSFLSPVMYVLAMGVLLGGFIAGDPDQLEGATSYLAFVVPGLVAAHAMQTAVGEVTWPVMGAIKWHRTYYAQLATPLEPVHLVAGHLMFVLFRLATTCGVFMLVLAEWIAPDFSIDGFWTYIGATIVVSIVNWAMHSIFGMFEGSKRPELAS